MMFDYEFENAFLDALDQLEKEFEKIENKKKEEDKKTESKPLTKTQTENTVKTETKPEAVKKSDNAVKPAISLAPKEKITEDKVIANWGLDYYLGNVIHEIYAYSKEKEDTLKEYHLAAAANWLRRKMNA